MKNHHWIRCHYFTSRIKLLRGILFDFPSAANKNNAEPRYRVDTIPDVDTWDQLVIRNRIIVKELPLTTCTENESDDSIASDLCNVLRVMQETKHLELCEVQWIARMTHDRGCTTRAIIQLWPFADCIPRKPVQWHSMHGNGVPDPYRATAWCEYQIRCMNVKSIMGERRLCMRFFAGLYGSSSCTWSSCGFSHRIPDFLKLQGRLMKVPVARLETPPDDALAQTAVLPESCSPFEFTWTMQGAGLCIPTEASDMSLAFLQPVGARTRDKMELQRRLIWAEYPVIEQEANKIGEGEGGGKGQAVSTEETLRADLTAALSYFMQHETFKLRDIAWIALVQEVSGSKHVIPRIIVQLRSHVSMDKVRSVLRVRDSRRGYVTSFIEQQVASLNKWLELFPTNKIQKLCTTSFLQDERSRCTCIFVHDTASVQYFLRRRQNYFELENRYSGFIANRTYAPQQRDPATCTSTVDVASSDATVLSVKYEATAAVAPSSSSSDSTSVPSCDSTSKEDAMPGAASTSVISCDAVVVPTIKEEENATDLSVCQTG